MRSLLLAAALLFGGLIIGLVITGWLEPILEPILALFDEPPKPLGLMLVDFDPFDPCVWEATSPHDLCI